MKSILENTLPVKNQKPRSITTIETDLGNAGNFYRQALGAAKGAQIDAERLEAQIVARGTSVVPSGENMDEPANYRQAYMAIEQVISEAVLARAYADLINACPEVKEAREIVQPLLDELAAAQALEIKVNQEHAIAERTIAEAKDKARAEFEKSLDAVPEVVAAVKQATPFLRKGVLVA
jgi:hypothetical protein